MISDGADLRHWLQVWASWMRIYADELGYPGCACAMEQASTNYAVAEDDAENYWQRYRIPAVVAVIDTCIDDLEPRYREAIWYAHGVRKVPPDDVSMVYGMAFDRLQVMVCNRIAIA